MIISVDTNILIQASLGSNVICNMLDYIINNHILVLSNYVIDEYREVLKRDYIKRYKPNNILNLLQYKVINNHVNDKNIAIHIRDENDYDILLDVITGGIDVFITNDKDFIESSIKSTKVLTSIQFYDEFML